MLFRGSLGAGKPGFEKAHGVGFFDYLAQHPEDASLFSQMMVGLNSQEPPAVAAAYDFATFRTIVDVGGATGNLLAAVLACHPGTHGILLDRPHVVKDAPTLLEATGVRERVTISPAISLQAYRPVRMPTSSRISSTTGAKIGV